MPHLYVHQPIFTSEPASIKYKIAQRDPTAWLSGESRVSKILNRKPTAEMPWAAA